MEDANVKSSPPLEPEMEQALLPAGKWLQEIECSFLVKEERLAHSVQSLQEAEQKISGTLSEALRLAPRLRDLGTELIAMRRHQNPAQRLATLPVRVEPLYAPKPAQKRGQGQGMRLH